MPTYLYLTFTIVLVAVVKLPINAQVTRGYVFSTEQVASCDSSEVLTAPANLQWNAGRNCVDVTVVDSNRIRLSAAGDGALQANGANANGANVVSLGTARFGYLEVNITSPTLNLDHPDNYFAYHLVNGDNVEFVQVFSQEASYNVRS